MNECGTETLGEFRKSLSYGSRTDLLFKFMGSNGMKDPETAEFFHGLLEELGDAFDTGEYDRVVDHCFRWQRYANTSKEDARPAFQYDTTPWASLATPLSYSRVALISTGGLFVEGDDPASYRPTQPTTPDCRARGSHRPDTYVAGGPGDGVVRRATVRSRVSKS